MEANSIDGIMRAKDWWVRAQRPRGEPETNIPHRQSLSGGFYQIKGEGEERDREKEEREVD